VRIAETMVSILPATDRFPMQRVYKCAYPLSATIIWTLGGKHNGPKVPRL